MGGFPFDETNLKMVAAPDLGEPTESLIEEALHEIAPFAF